MSPNILIAYYSFSRNTENFALEIALQTGGELREIVPEQAYSFDYNTATKEVRAEIERGYCPQLISGGEPIDAYDTVFIGSPNWFKSIAPPVLSFLRAHDFSEKTLVPFCTHGGGGFGEIERCIAQECSGARLIPGLAMGGTIDEAELERWLDGIVR
ncbi:flavodoxin [Ruminococcaceae bacterium OttesenSCG-928-A16]|nr:flavodoxin [Eubacteriales bacterium OttesenSCG-928-N13]MDL2324419.1 flavodoxin [Ruminococcaceae bacterium OttesenSCG-928-A16]